MDERCPLIPEQSGRTERTSECSSTALVAQDGLPDCRVNDDNSSSHQSNHTSRMAISRLKTAIWGPPGVERSLLIKLDSTVLVYFSLIWFLFGINRASYSTAYISGMKEALNFQGKQYNYMNTTFIVTYAVFQMPSTSLLTILPPRYVFVAANTLWSILTLITFRVERVWQVFVLNGFEGALSAIC